MKKLAAVFLLLLAVPSIGEDLHNSEKVGRYQVVSGTFLWIAPTGLTVDEKTFIEIDSVTGDTWILNQGEKSKNWIPLKRFLNPPIQ